MRRLLFISWFAVMLSIPALRAKAVYGVPAQGPDVTDGGKFEIHPGIGLVAGDHDFLWFGDADSFVIVPRLRYGISDSLQWDVHLGGMIGDLSAFALGTGLMFQFVSQKHGGPVGFSAFFNLDLAVGELDTWPGSADVDITLFTLLSGVLISHTFKTKKTELTPYCGLGLGFTFVDLDLTNADDDDTEIAFDVIMGFELGLSEKYKVFTEFDFGPTDGLPVLVWQLGLSYTF